MWAKSNFLIIHLVIASLFGSGAGASTFELYIQDLGGDNEQARATARQMLPREGVRAVPKLIELLKSENMNVWRAAFNVLEDIANATTQPGKEAERAQVTEELLSLVSPDQPEILKERGLRLLPLVLSDGYDVTPVAALLKDPGLREKARACFLEASTSSAAHALADRLVDSDPAFTCALLEALAAIRDLHTVSAIQPLLSHSDPHIRATALRSLAWTGNPDLLKEGEEIFEKSDPDTHWEAGDALLRLADEILRKGGNHTLGIATYEKIFNQTKDTNLQAAALAGMGRFGDESVVPTLLKALSGPNESNLAGPAWMAFGSLNGQAVNVLLIQAYPSLNHENKLMALATFGRKADPSFLPLLEEALLSQEMDTHRVAAGALADSQLPEAVPLLAKDISSRSGEPRKETLLALKKLAGEMRFRKEGLAAGEAYYALCQAADSEDLRKEAFEGVKSFPTPAALEMLLEKTETFDLNDSGQLLSSIDIVRGLVAAGRGDEADRILDRLIPRIQTPELIAQTLQALAGFLPAKDCAQRFGFITSWKIVGGFPWALSEGFTKTCIGEPAVDLNATYPIGEKTVGWVLYSSTDATGLIDLAAAVGQKDQVCAFAFTRVKVESDMDGLIRVGSDDGIRVWVNEQAVLERNVDRGSQIDQDSAPIHLKAGENRILIQISQGGGGWNAYIRLIQKDGAPLEFSPMD